MATNYLANGLILPVATTVGWLNTGTGVGSVPHLMYNNSEWTEEISFTPPITLAVNDFVLLAQIPTGIIVDEWLLDWADNDSSTALVWGLGDTAASAHSNTPSLANWQANYATALTTGRSAGIAYSQANGVAGTLPLTYTAADWLVLKITTGATGASTPGLIKGWVRWKSVVLTS